MEWTYVNVIKQLMRVHQSVTNFLLAPGAKPSLWPGSAASDAVVSASPAVILARNLQKGNWKEGKGWKILHSKFDLRAVSDEMSETWPGSAISFFANRHMLGSEMDALCTCGL
eukprot:TRINITY_DN1385_c0_g2_i1.p2 TRINITY_DN1385_c0_g2~~TRINITY_DN1385_c0_g2_i1.p2  ORF type:complete len:113 (+),score=10.11 TRINITY_DN1385_c0_g2_i1:166-504(+)